MVDCPLKGKWFVGCRFEPRYDLSPADLSQLKSISAEGDVVESFRTKTYVRDVCVRCGLAIERSRDPV